MDITIKLINGRSEKVNVKLNATVNDLKMKIYSKLNLQIDEQELLFNSQILKNEETLSSYRIGNNAVINLSTQFNNEFPVTISMDNEFFDIPVKRNIKISDLKKRIVNTKNVDAKKITLTFQGNVLQDDDTVDKYKIQRKSIICVVHKLN